MARKDKYVVRLPAGHRRQLEQMVSSGKHPARVLTRARVLLKADADGPGWDGAAIAEALDCGGRTVARVRQKYAGGGLDAALYAKKPTGRQYRKLDGGQEAKLIAVACSPAPDGRARWTMERLVELEVVESIDPATVWRTLKKTRSSRGSSSSGSSRPGRARRS